MNEKEILLDMPAVAHSGAAKGETFVSKAIGVQISIENLFNYFY